MKNFLLVFLLIFVFSSLPVFAASNGQGITKLDNPVSLEGADNPAILIGYIIQALLGIVGGVALVMMVYGGFQWLTAAGSEEKIKSGTQTMLWSVIGLVLVFSSYIIAKVIIDAIYGNI